MAYEQFKRVTELTQATLALDAVLSPQASQGELPTAGALRALIALDEKFKGKREILHNAAMTFQPLRDLLSQYIDLNTGNPLTGAAAQNGGIVLRDKFACFGRSCGEQQGCFASCSLGPSHMANGEPLGPVGKAPVRWPNGQVMNVPEVAGVLKKLDGGVATMPDGKPRHRDNSCLFLSMASKVLSIPPAPSGELADKLYLMMFDVLNHVMEKAVLPAVPAPAPAPMPAVAPPPPMMTGATFAIPPVAPPPMSAPLQQAAPNIAPPPAAPAPAVQAAVPAASTGFPKFPAEFDPKARTELCALVVACTRSAIKPMSEKAAQNMIDRHVKEKHTPKKMRSAWVKAAFDRGAATDSTVAGKLKREAWPKDIPEIQGYWDAEVVPVAEPAPTGLATGGPVLAAPIGQPAAPVHHFQPQAPATQPQKIDAVETVAPATNINATARAVAPVKEKSVIKEVAGMLRTAAKNLMDAAALLMSDTIEDEDGQPEETVAASAPVAEGAASEETVKAKKGKKAAKAPKAEKKKPGRKKNPGTLTAKPHPKHPEVHAEASAWQPGSRGRPPKGITRTRDGVLKFGKGWKEINGKWHAPLKA